MMMAIDRQLTTKSRKDKTTKREEAATTRDESGARIGRVSATC
jgi:hypothetical protein